MTTPQTCNEPSSIHIKRQTKIVATLGPATTSVESIAKLFEAGLSVGRLNMSHGDHAEHTERIINFRTAARATGVYAGLLVDLSGPKIRTGELATDTLDLIVGQPITLTTEEVAGTHSLLTVRYPNLSKEVKVGGFVMLDDGRRKLLVERIEDTLIHCTVVVGGVIKARRGVNMPGSYLSIAAITEKDVADLALAIAHRAEYIAISFVRTGADIVHLKSLLPAGYTPRIIAKIETEEALDTIDNILNESDGIMIARGDLAIEVPREKVPVIQKMLIRKARAQRKLVITATQMLESMIKAPVPTRAEVSDIATAIFDGTDAVMLSEESAMGDYAKEAVEMMAQVARATDPELRPRVEEIVMADPRDSLKKQAVRLADEVGAKAIIALTETGSTAHKLAAFKGRRSVIAVTHSETVARELSLVRGVWPVVHPGVTSVEELRKTIRTIVAERCIAGPGESVVVVSGMTFGTTGASNMMFVEYV
jgi:pyruvate kinase